ncbi:MAG: hypothetical protein AB1589_00190 [Cyanobacteriota bacterium]|jgi:hypothetical protein
MLFWEGNRLVFGSDYASLQYAVTVMQVIVRRVRLVYQQEANCLQVMKKLAIIQFS